MRLPVRKHRCNESVSMAAEKLLERNDPVLDFDIQEKDLEDFNNVLESEDNLQFNIFFLISLPRIVASYQDPPWPT